MENVAALLRRGLDVVEADLASIGYDTSWLCLRASDIGAAHRRDRLFLLYLDSRVPLWCRSRGEREVIPLSGAVPPRPDPGPPRWHALRDAVPVPPDLPAAIEEYGAAVRLLHREFLAGKQPVQARHRVLSAVRLAGEACRQEIRFSGTIVVSQLRTVANELLRATGVRRDEARHLVRRAAAGH